jgi:hypothetical protein
LTENLKKKIKIWLRSNKEVVEATHILASIAAIISIVIAIIALWCSVNTFKTELTTERCNKLEAEKIKINGLIQEIDYNI